MNPTVSFIVPVYNASSTLGRCVDAILRQTWTDWELLLVDDGSSDGSGTICDGYAQSDARIHVFHQPNGGVSKARNRALIEARGAYIRFLDSDDWIPEDSTALLVDKARRTSCDMVVGDFWRVVDKRVAKKGPIDEEGVITRDAYVHAMSQTPADFYWGVLWNKLYRTDLIRRAGMTMDEELSWCEDFVFNLEYLLHVSTIAILKAPVYYYVKTENSLGSLTLSRLGKMVRIKWDLLSYYGRFYRALYDEDKEAYARKRPAIYRILIDVAHDGGAGMLVPGTKKLGKEDVRIEINQNLARNLLSDAYYLDKLVDHYLLSVGTRFALDVKETKAEAYLYFCRSSAMEREVADFLGVASASLVLGRLQAKKLARKEKIGRYVFWTLGEDSDAVCRALAEVFSGQEADGGASFRRQMDQRIDAVRKMLAP